MTVDFFHFDMAFLGRVANRIVNEVRGVNRGPTTSPPKLPRTIEWE
jgi:GMP synthase (glutamine-hydrolysing)